MNDLKEYIVTLHSYKDLDSFYDDMETVGGNLYIPDRAIDLADRRPVSRNTHYYLTESEAEQIRQDPRVAAVRLNINLKVELTWTQTGLFRKSGTFTSSDKNWGLLRSITGTYDSAWGLNGTEVKTATISHAPEGKNVDIVIVDGHIRPTHKEFTTNSDGTGSSRVQQFNWFSLNPTVRGTAAGTYVYDTTGQDHGTHVAGIAAGNTQGWARQANIYNICPLPSSNSLNINHLFDYVREWHKNKAINPYTGRKNPTICNNSWGYSLRFTVPGNLQPPGWEETAPGSNIWNPYFEMDILYRGELIRGPFRVKNYAYTDPTNTRNLLNLGFVGVSGNVNCQVDQASLRADIQDAINDGIIMVWSAGNDSNNQDKVGGLDVNNKIVKPDPAQRTLAYDNFTVYPEMFINRHSVLGDNSMGVIIVGNIENSRFESTAVDSNRGPAVDIWAAGTQIQSSVASLSTAGTVADPRGGSDRLDAYNGTSMAAPQVAGYLATLLELSPSMTQAEIKAYLIANAKIGQVIELSTWNPANPNYSAIDNLQGGPNRHLFAPQPTFTISVNKTAASGGQNITYNVQTTNVPNNAIVYLTESGTADTSTFTDNTLSLQVQIFNNTGTYIRSVTPSLATSVNSTMQLRLGGTTGTIYATAPTVTITPSKLRGYFVVGSKNSVTLTLNNDVTTEGTERLTLTLDEIPVAVFTDIADTSK